MTTPLDTPDLTTDAQLSDWLEGLLSPAVRRQLWLAFLDEDDHPAGPLMPIDDYPADPDALIDTDDLGRRTIAEVYAHRFAFLMRELGFAQIVLVWERRGGSATGAEEKAWARAFGAALRAEGARVRAQFLLHDRGLRLVAPDDVL